MLVSRASLASLNTRLGAAGSELVVEETRFRPNILISGDFEGFQEDRSVRLNVLLTRGLIEVFQMASCQD